MPASFRVLCRPRVYTSVKDVVFCPGALRAALEPAFGARRFKTYVDGGGDPGELDRPHSADLSRLLHLPLRESRRLARKLNQINVAACAVEAERLGAKILTWGGAQYPAVFERLSDPPPALFVQGEPPLPDETIIAVVGSRKATRYGLRMARALAGDLARAGFTVVSGLARGVDCAAHEAVLAAGGRTLAVLGSGLARPYPQEHLDLLDRIKDGGGAAISELPLDAPPRPAHFPMRNRLVAALSQAIIVVEAGRRSGALSTARHAADLGVEVLAVPGPVDREQSLGTLGLIRDGATPISCVQDLFTVLGFCDPGRLELPEPERKVLESIAPDGSTASELNEQTGFGVEVAAGYLVTLEVRGLIERETGGRYVVR